MNKFWKILIVVFFIFISGCVFAQNADDKVQQEPDFVKMVSPQKDDDFLQIYNYVCEYVQIK